MQENLDQNNSEYGHFLRSEACLYRKLHLLRFRFLAEVILSDRKPYASLFVVFSLSDIVLSGSSVLIG